MPRIGGHIMSLQLDLFTREKPTLEIILDDLKNLKSSTEKTRDTSEKVRKSTWANIGELRKKYVDLSERMEIIERHLCRGETVGDPELVVINLEKVAF